MAPADFLPVVRRKSPLTAPVTVAILPPHLQFFRLVPRRSVPTESFAVNAASSPAPRSVLVVDPSAENREVLRTVLRRRGLRTWEADEAEAGVALAREHHPDVIVLDLDANDDASGAAQAQLCLELSRESSSLIILGKLRRGSLLTAGHVLSKPYHFAPLVHTIEELAAAAKAA